MAESVALVFVAFSAISSICFLRKAASYHKSQQPLDSRRHRPGDLAPAFAPFNSASRANQMNQRRSEWRSVLACRAPASRSSKVPPMLLRSRVKALLIEPHSSESLASAGKSFLIAAFNSSVASFMLSSDHLIVR